MGKCFLEASARALSGIGIWSLKGLKRRGKGSPSLSESVALSGSYAKGTGEGQEYVVRSCSSWFPRHAGLVRYIGSMAIFDWPEDGLHNYWAAMFVRQSKRTDITYGRLLSMAKSMRSLSSYCSVMYSTRVDEGIVAVFLANIKLISKFAHGAGRRTLLRTDG